MGGFAANPRALSGCDYMMNKKQKNTLLLSACKGNENLMRLDFSFFFSSSQHSQRFDSPLDSRFEERLW